jgi:hypothetical protein
VILSTPITNHESRIETSEKFAEVRAKGQKQQFFEIRRSCF